MPVAAPGELLDRRATPRADRPALSELTALAGALPDDITAAGDAK
jgi:hypothetical protein